MILFKSVLFWSFASVTFLSSVLQAATQNKVIRDIPYDSSIGSAGFGDLFLPKKIEPKTPVILTIHGGGWSGGNRASWEGVSRFFTDRLGFVAFNIEYRLASPSNRWPACGNDCVKAARFLLSSEFKKRFALTHDKIWICGGSAGGHLSLWTLTSLSPENVAGCISISSIGDPAPDNVLHPFRYNMLFGKSRDLSAMDPRKGIRCGMAPVLCTHVENDTVVPVKSHLAFVDAYRAAGNVCRTYIYQDSVIEGLTGHCIWVPGSGPYRRLIPQLESAIAAFVKNPYWVKSPCRNNMYEGEPYLCGGIPKGLELVETVKFDAIPQDTNRFSSVGVCRIGNLNGVKYLEAGEKAYDRWAYRFLLPDDAPLYAFEVDYPDDKKRTMDIVVQGSQETQWDGEKGADYILQPGMACGDEYKNSGEIRTARYIYWRKGDDVTLSTMTARGGAPAAISEIRLYRIAPATLPRAEISEPPPNDEGWRRTFALYYEDVSVGYNFAVDGDGGDVKSIGPLIDRIAATMKYTGQNLLCYPGCWYDGLIEKGYLPRSHVVDYRERFYEAFDREGLGFMPLINQFRLKGVRLTPDEIRKRYGDKVNMSAVAIMDNGKPTDGKFAGRPAAWCILHSRVQSEIEKSVDTFLKEGASHPSFKGIMLLLTRNSLLWFGNDTSGYNDYAVRAFMKDRKIALPFNETDPLRAKIHAEWIRKNAYEKWIDWRCEKVAAFYRRLAAKVAATRPDLKLVINSFLLPDCRHKDFGAEDFIVEANRRAGLDASKLKDVPNISVAQTQMPADYRWMSSRDPSDPSRGHWGKDWICAEPFYRSLYSGKKDFGSIDLTSYPWVNQHDRYWESHCGATRKNCCHGLYDRDQSKPKLTTSWLTECPWRVSTINPAGRNALRHYAVPLRHRDVLAMSKGGFLIGTYGTEDVLVPWIRAFRSLPAVKMEDCARDGDVVIRTCNFRNKRYFYAVNTSDEDNDIRFAFPAGTKDVIGGKIVTDPLLRLKPYELRSFVFDCKQ